MTDYLERRQDAFVGADHWCPGGLPPPPDPMTWGIDTPESSTDRTRCLLERDHGEEGTRKTLGLNWLRGFPEFRGARETIRFHRQPPEGCDP